MEKTIQWMAVCVGLLALNTACRSAHDNDLIMSVKDSDSNLSISVTDSDDLYKITADYDEDKTWKLYKYINKSIKPNGLFASEDDYMDVTTELSDHTKFYVKASPGELLIKLNKKENSHGSYLRMKKLGEGLKKVLED